MSASATRPPLKWRARVLLHRLGLWDTLEMGRMLGSYALRIPHEEDFRFFGNFDGEPGLFLDIGANRGQSALSFRIFNKSCRILSLEPNRKLARDLNLLKKVFGESFSYRMHGLGDAERTLTMYTPEIAGISLTQETTSDPALLKDNFIQHRLQMLTGTATHRVRKQSLKIRKLDDLRLSPKFIKIDAQGAEPAILQGATETLARSQPIILMESNLKVHEFLPDGYEIRCYDPKENRLVPFKAAPGSLNLFLIPKSGEADLKKRSLL